MGLDSADVSDVSDVNSSSESPSHKSTSSSSGDELVTPQTLTHSVVFKCMGCLKEFHYQEILALVSRKMKDGSVPVELREEPNNPVDSRAIAFVCKLNNQWERIGYVASEALEAVYYAIRENSIIEVRFEWVKYIVYFKNQGWYAGIIIKKKYEWPQIIQRCSAKSFN